MKLLYALTHGLETKEGGASYSMDGVVKEISKRHECIPFICPKEIEPYGLLPTLKQRAKINPKYGEYFLRNIIRDTNPDIVHTSGYGSCLLGEFIKDWFHIPWVHHCRSLSDALFLHTLENPDHMILIGEWMNHTKLKKLRVPKTVIYNPVPFDLNPSFSLNGREGIIMIGDGSGRKGTQIGLKAWKSNRTQTLHIFGNVKRSNRRNVVYHGLVSQDELLQAIRRARFTLFPKRFPGWFDRTLLESQSVGTIALQSCGRRVYDPPVANAVRFSPRLSSLKSALESALSMDGNEYRKMSRQAYGWVKENCTAERSAREIEKVYDLLA